MNKSPLLTASGAAALLAAALLPAACGTTGGAVATGPAADRRFYEARCGICHVPWGKDDFLPEEWPALVAEYAPRAGLTKAQRARVLRYLTSPDEPAPPIAASR